MQQLDWLTFEQLTTNELYQLLKIRSDVFVVEQQSIYPDLDDLDQEALHLLVRENDQLIAYLRVLPPNTAYEVTAIGRVVVAEGARGKGLSKAMMISAIEKAQQVFDADAIKLSAQIHLQDFYGKLGFVAKGEPYDDGGIDHIDMLLKRGAS